MIPRRMRKNHILFLELFSTVRGIFPYKQSPPKKKADAIHLLFIIGISILLNPEVFAAIRGEIKISARLMPFERATQTLFGIVHTPNEAANLGTVAVPRLVIHRADRKIARAGEVAEKASARCCDNATVVLCHNVRDH